MYRIVLEWMDIFIAIDTLKKKYILTSESGQ